MNESTTHIELTRELLDFLTAHGYTHLLSIGIIPGKGEEDYWLEPMLNADPRIGAEETDHIVNGISSHEAYDMAAGDEFISFFVTIPLELFKGFKGIA